uniref:RPW8 domain-containing protein n=1 Tax=Quercus lobata TaxID=97700 RepID=A0A7N2RCM9_QUELO
MAAEAALGAAFGEVFAVLHDAVKEVVGKVRYSTELKELDDEIRRFCQVDLQVHNTRNVLKTLEQVKHIVKRVDSLRARDEPPGTKTETLVNGGRNYKGPKSLAPYKSPPASPRRSIFAPLFSCFGY